MKMKTGNRSKSASSASVRSDKAFTREEALSESKDIEHNFEELSLEYSEVNNNIRHYSALRFAIFTVYFAVIGGIVSIAFGFFENKTGNSELTKLCARIGGFLISLLFLVLEVNCEQYLTIYGDVAASMEEELRYKQITTRKRVNYHHPLLRPRYAARSIYVAMILFWLAMIIWILWVIARA
jgi:hypothetical protein